jgi:hypothetical protein
MARPSQLLAAPLALALFAAGCTIERKPAAPPERVEPPKPAAAVEAEKPVAVPCVLDVSDPGPLRRAGRAKVRLSGKGLSVDTEVPALCGPLFNRDVDALQVRAGEGLLFEACVPEGYLQLTSRERVLGAQKLHHGGQKPGAMDVSFNRVGAATYSSHGLATDRVTLDDDFWKVDAELTLRDVADSHDLRASFTFDCSASEPTR